MKKQKALTKYRVILELSSFASVEVEATSKNKAADIALQMDHAGQVDYGEAESEAIEVSKL